MKSTEVTPKEQLELIEQTINQAKENLCAHSFSFLFWGWLVSFTAILNYILLSFTSLAQQSYIVWPIITFLGTFFIINYYRKKGKTAAYHTHLEYFLSRMWMVIGAVLVLTSFITPFILIDPWFFFPIIAAIGIIVSGVILKFNPLIFGGIVLIAFPFYSKLFNEANILLLYAVVIMITLLIPGYILKGQKK